AQNGRRDRRADAPRADDGLHVFGGADGGTVEGDQDVAEQNARLRGGAVGLDVDNEQSISDAPVSLRLKASGRRAGCSPTPRQPRLTWPLSINSSATRTTVETGMASSSCRDSPEALIPTTRPWTSTSGPPEKPG